jgi:hypothetical protein
LSPRGAKRFVPKVALAGKFHLLRCRSLARLSPSVERVFRNGCQEKIFLIGSWHLFQTDREMELELDIARSRRWPQTNEGDRVVFPVFLLDRDRRSSPEIRHGVIP